MKNAETRPNWYRIALSRRVNREARRRAWKIILVIEACGASVGYAAFYFIPTSMLAIVLLSVFTVLFIGTLVYLHR